MKLKSVAALAAFMFVGSAVASASAQTYKVVDANGKLVGHLLSSNTVIREVLNRLPVQFELDDTSGGLKNSEFVEYFTASNCNSQIYLPANTQPTKAYTIRRGSPGRGRIFYPLLPFEMNATIMSQRTRSPGGITGTCVNLTPTTFPIGLAKSSAISFVPPFKTVPE